MLDKDLDSYKQEKGTEDKQPGEFYRYLESPHVFLSGYPSLRCHWLSDSFCLGMAWWLSFLCNFLLGMKSLPSLKCYKKCVTSAQLPDGLLIM